MIRRGRGGGGVGRQNESIEQTGSNTSRSSCDHSRIPPNKKKNEPVSSPSKTGNPDYFELARVNSTEAQKHTYIYYN